ncbi:hypothetical protein [Deinococcus sp.]|uniref:hypothetical protein n=1 Tax=Deinococcus sp. TaxID=47478 RepID=UPI003CC64719
MRISSVQAVPRALLCAPLLSVVLLSACDSKPSVPTVASIKLTGPNGPLLLDTSTKLGVSVTGSDGLPFAQTATFTSSDPTTLSVSSDGTLTARHLTAAASPVIITAAVGGKSAVTTVGTYGLDVVGGTYTSAGNPAGYSFTATFRDAGGLTLTSDTDYTVQGPSTFNKGKPLTGTLYAANAVTFHTGTDVPAVSGSYTASIRVGTQSYTKTFTVDASMLLPLPSAAVTLSRSGYSVSGTLPAALQEAFLNVTANGSSVRRSAYFSALPTSGPWTSTLPAGTYATGIFARSYNGSQMGAVVFPDQINRSYADTGTVTVP